MRGGGGGGRGFGGFGGEGNSDKRYNLAFSISARNLLNHVNPGPPAGNISAARFGQSTALAGGFGPERAAANNRRIDLQVRFSF